MIKVFDKTTEYSGFSQNGINSGELYYVKEDKTAHFRTNNIDGIDKVYDMSEDGGSAAVLIEGNFTTNGTFKPEQADGYSEVNISVPIPSGYIIPSGTKSIVENGTGIDITTYAYVDVAVPASGITPTGTYNITVNNETYDISSYAYAYVSVPTSGGGPITGTVQADAQGTAYIPCAEDEVLYYESSAMMNAPYMFMDSNMQPLPIDGYGAPCLGMKESDHGSAKSFLVYLQDEFDMGYDFSTVAYAMVNTTANATINYERMTT